MPKSFLAGRKYGRDRRHCEIRRQRMRSEDTESREGKPLRLLSASSAMSSLGMSTCLISWIDFKAA